MFNQLSHLIINKKFVNKKILGFSPELVSRRLQEPHNYAVVYEFLGGIHIS